MDSNRSIGDGIEEKEWMSMFSREENENSFNEEDDDNNNNGSRSREEDEEDEEEDDTRSYTRARKKMMMMKKIDIKALENVINILKERLTETNIDIKRQEYNEYN